MRQKRTRCIINARLLRGDHAPGTIFSCEAVSGFEVWFNATVPPTFRWRGRVRGLSKPVVPTIGRYGDLTLAEAQAVAAQCRQWASRGINPVDKLKAERQATYREARNAAETYVELIPEYIARMRSGNHNSSRTASPSAKHVHNEERRLRDFVPLFGEVPVAEFGPQEAQEAKIRFGDDGAPDSRRVRYQALQRYFDDLYTLEKVKSNPFRIVKAPPKGRPRARFLRRNEIPAVWFGAAELPQDWCDYFRLMLCWPVRKMNGAQLRKEQVDFERGTIWLDQTKSGDEWEVPFPDLAREILARRVSDDMQPDDYLFPSRSNRNRGRRAHINDFPRKKRQLDDASGVTEWKLHDFRRTVATHLSNERDIPSTMSDLWLQHRPQDLRATYNASKFVREQRVVCAAWDGLLREFLEIPTFDGNVVPLPRSVDRSR